MNTINIYKIISSTLNKHSFKFAGTMCTHLLYIFVNIHSNGCNNDSDKKTNDATG